MGRSQTGKGPDLEEGAGRVVVVDENSSDVMQRVRLGMRAEMMPSLVQGVKME